MNPHKRDKIKRETLASLGRLYQHKVKSELDSQIVLCSHKLMISLCCHMHESLSVWSHLIKLELDVLNRGARVSNRLSSHPLRKDWSLIMEVKNKYRG